MRSSASASPPLSPTSCGRRSRGCWPCSSRLTCPVPTATTCLFRRGSRSRRCASSSTTCCSSPSSRAAARWSRSARRRRCRVLEDVTGQAGRQRRARRRHHPHRGRPRRRAAVAPAHAADRRREPARRTRSATRARARRSRSRREPGGALEVADDGTGVGEEELPRLFERFFSGDRARASRGTGLGLAIVKHVVVSAGGSVQARGGPGGGCV